MITLRRALLVNSIFSILTGLAMALNARSLASTLEVPAVAVRSVGIGVLLFGAIIAFNLGGRLSAEFAALVIGLDILWVLGAIVILFVPGVMANGWILALVSLAVAGLAAWQTVGLIRHTRESPRRIETSVDIAGSPQEVWAHLSDLGAYGEWNPFIVRATGRPQVGESLALTMKTGKREMNLTPTVTGAEAPRSLEWLGTLGPGAVFDGRHRIEVIARDEGSALIHSEEFSGFLVPFVWKSVGASTEEGFQAMNQALKQRVEGDLRHSA